MRKLILLTMIFPIFSLSALDLYEEVSTKKERDIYDYTIEDFVAANEESVRNKNNNETYSPCHLQDAMTYLDSPTFVEDKAMEINWDERAKDGEVSIFFVEKEEEEISSDDIRVMGMTEEEAVLLSKDPGGEACSNKHNQGDVANRWCHTVIVDYINRGLIRAGVNPIVSHVASAAFFVPKEFLYDKNPSLSDMGGPDIKVYEKNNSKISVTPFADGAVFVTVDKRF